MNFKLTPLEKKWILYDVGNSAFAMLTATILPIYFNYLAKKAGLSSVDYLSYWGYDLYHRLSWNFSLCLYNENAA